MEVQQQETQSGGQTRIRVALALVAMLAISGCVIFQAGSFSAAKLRSGASFKGQAVRLPGVPMGNGDELWVLNAVDSASSIYKMVFSDGDILLYAKANAVPLSWGIVYTQLKNTGKTADWGTPYWKLSTAVDNYVKGLVKDGLTTKFKFTDAQRYNFYNSQGLIFVASDGTYNQGILVNPTDKSNPTLKSGSSWAKYLDAVKSNAYKKKLLSLQYSASSGADGTYAQTFTSGSTYGYVTVFSDASPVFQFRSYSPRSNGYDNIQFILTSSGNLILQATNGKGQSNTFFSTGDYGKLNWK